MIPGTSARCPITERGVGAESGDDAGQSEKIENRHGGMKLLVKRPANGAEAEPWGYDGLLPRRPGRW